jgi:hypothetical protein
VRLLCGQKQICVRERNIGMKVPARGYDVMNPMSKDKGLVASLCFNSMHQHACTALASTTATSRQHDKLPVFAHHGRTTCKQTALFIDRERFTQARRSCLEPDRSVGKGRDGGEPSLSPEGECLSLHSTILTHRRTSGNRERREAWRGVLPHAVIPPRA